MFFSLDNKKKKNIPKKLHKYFFLFLYSFFVLFVFIVLNYRFANK